MKVRNRITAAALSAVIAAGVFYAPLPQELNVTSVVADAATTAKVAAPKASLKSGTYNTSGSKTVKLTCSTKGAAIWYSVNGAAYKKYTKAITISKNTTLKFYAKSGSTKSKVVTVTYKLTPKVTLTPAAGSYSSAQTVKLSSPVKNVKFYYTLDGSKPTTKSKKYTSSGIKIDTDCTLRVLAVKSGWTKYYISKEYEISNSILYSYKDKYYYQQLSASEKKLYKTLFETINGYSKHTDISDGTYTPEQLNYVFELLRFENPQFFYIEDDYNYYYYEQNGITYVNGFDPVYRWNKTEGEKMKKEMETAAETILSKISDKTDSFACLTMIHDELVRRTNYNNSGDTRTYCAYGPLVYGDAICSGYAQAFCYLCQSVGIQCVDVNGKTTVDPNYYHEWNRLKADGEWYNMDVTFDDPMGVNEMYHSYFCVTDAVINLDHTIEPWFPFGSDAKAVSTELNYFAALGYDYYTDAKAAYDALVEISANAYLEGEKSTIIFCSPIIIEELYVMLDNYFTDAEKYGSYPSKFNANYIEDILTFTLE